uniref:Putative secreted protein n=1 Tax=Anopheles darlingi TaxID=43151 RepID=A0A2M4D9W3_ANODA
MAPTITSGISTFFSLLVVISAGVGLLLSEPSDWAAAFRAVWFDRPKALLLIEIGVAACVPGWRNGSNVVGSYRSMVVVRGVAVPAAPCRYDSRLSCPTAP